MRGKRSGFERRGVETKLKMRNEADCRRDNVDTKSGRDKEYEKRNRYG